VLAIVAAIAVLTFPDYGLGWDDFTHAQYGELLLALYTSGFRDTRALSFVNLYYYGGGFDMAAAALVKLLPFDLFALRRLLGAAVGLAGLAATWRIGRRAGGPLAGLIALLLLATCPLYYGHMFINPKDAPFAAAMAVFLLGLVRALAQYPRPSWATVAILGLGFGLAIGSRIMAGFGVLAASGAFALLVAVEWQSLGAREASARARTFMFALAPGAVVAIAVMALIWPWVVLDPFNLFRAIGYFAEFFEKPWQELFEGALFSPPDMPRRYVPVLFGLKLPELFLVLAMIGGLGALIDALRSRHEPRQRAIYLGIVLMAVLPVAVTIVAQPAMYNGIRHFVFVLPPLAVLGGLAGAFVVRLASQRWRSAPIMAGIVFIAGIGAPVVEMVRLHPYEYTHFNLLSGGVARARDRFMLDYWGLSLKQASQVLRTRLKKKKAVSGVC
jgi:4-amino-4-deoxy-L-arabinose transferase-like glycosyltransferase